MKLTPKKRKNGFYAVMVGQQAFCEKNELTLPQAKKVAEIMEQNEHKADVDCVCWDDAANIAKAA